MRSARLTLTAPARPYEHVRRPSEEVVDDGEPDGVQEEVEDAARRARGVADGDGGGAEQHGAAIVVDVVEQRVQEKVQSAAAVARGAVHLLLGVIGRGSGYAGDHRVEEGGHEVLSVVGFDVIHHVEGEVALEDEVQTSAHEKMGVRILVEGASLHIPIEDGAKGRQQRLLDRLVAVFAHDQEGVVVYGTGEPRCLLTV